MKDWIAFWDIKSKEFVYLNSSKNMNKAHTLKKKIIGEVCSTLPKLNKPEYLSWFKSALANEEQKWFVADVFNFSSYMPERLLIPFLEAAINEKNASKNKYFVGPCVKVFGPEKVINILNDYTVSGSDQERSGADSALYWVKGYS